MISEEFIKTNDVHIPIGLTEEEASCIEAFWTRFRDETNGKIMSTLKEVEEMVNSDTLCDGAGIGGRLDAYIDRAICIHDTTFLQKSDGMYYICPWFITDIVRLIRRDLKNPEMEFEVLKKFEHDVANGASTEELRNNLYQLTVARGEIRHPVLSAIIDKLTQVEKKWATNALSGKC